MAEQLTRKLYGRITSDDSGTIRMDLTPEESNEIWYIEFSEPAGRDETGLDVPGPPDWVTFTAGTEIKVVRHVTAGEFMTFLGVARLFGKPTDERAVAPTDKGRPPNGGKDASKVSYVTGDFGMGGGGGTNRGNANPTGTDTEDTEDDDYVEWPSCPSSLGFRC
jgi:hypothetical protein